MTGPLHRGFGAHSDTGKAIEGGKPYVIPLEVGSPRPGGRAFRILLGPGAEATRPIVFRDGALLGRSAALGVISPRNSANGPASATGSAVGWRPAGSGKLFETAETLGDTWELRVEEPKPSKPEPAGASMTAYVTATGSRYDSAGCRYLAKSSRPTTLAEAPCSERNPLLCRDADYWRPGYPPTRPPRFRLRTLLIAVDATVSTAATSPGSSITLTAGRRSQ